MQSNPLLGIFLTSERWFDFQWITDQSRGWLVACKKACAMNPILLIQHGCSSHGRNLGRLLFAAALILTFAAGSTSCRTTYGLGQDIEKTGDKIQEAATR
jgi:predicted small secreted protein